MSGVELGDRLFYYLCGNTYWPLCDTYCLHSLHSFNLSPASVSTDSPLLPIVSQSEIAAPLICFRFHSESLSCFVI